MLPNLAGLLRLQHNDSILSACEAFTASPGMVQRQETGLEVTSMH